MGKIVVKNVVERKAGHLYYVDGKGNVCEAKMARGGKKKKKEESSTVMLFSIAGVWKYWCVSCKNKDVATMYCATRNTLAVKLRNTASVVCIHW